MVWKILTVQISESRVSRRLFPEEQKGCHKERRGTVHRPAYSQGEQNESDKCWHGVD